MAICPVSHRRAPVDVIMCEEWPGTDICRACPACDVRMRLGFWLRDVWWVLRALLPLALAAVLFSSLALPASAAHNPAHSCPDSIAQAISEGRMGGTYYTNGGVVTWTNGVYVCVLAVTEAGPVPKTLFKSRNADQYLAKDAARKGLQQVTPSAASRILGAGSRLAGASGSGLTAIPHNVICDVMWYLAECQRTVQQ